MVNYQTVGRPPYWDDEVHPSETGDFALEMFEEGADAMLSAIEKAIMDGSFSHNTIKNCLNGYGLNIWSEPIED